MYTQLTTQINADRRAHHSHKQKQHHTNRNSTNGLIFCPSLAELDGGSIVGNICIRICTMLSWFRLG